MRAPPDSTSPARWRQDPVMRAARYDFGDGSRRYRAMEDTDLAGQAGAFRTRSLWEEDA